MRNAVKLAIGVLAVIPLTAAAQQTKLSCSKDMSYSAEFLANRVNIDTGAYATGNLTLMSIQGSRMLAV